MVRTYLGTLASVATFLGIQPFLLARLVTFGLVGIAVNVIYGALFMLIAAVAPEQRAFAAICAYGTACVFQYIANARLTFEQPVLDRGRFLRYCSTVLLGLIASTVFLVWIGPALNLNDLLSIILIALSIPFLNFTIFSSWVYKANVVKSTSS